MFDKANRSLVSIWRLKYHSNGCEEISRAVATSRKGTEVTTYAWLVFRDACSSFTKTIIMLLLRDEIRQSTNLRQSDHGHQDATEMYKAPANQLVKHLKYLFKIFRKFPYVI